MIRKNIIRKDDILGNINKESRGRSFNIWRYYSFIMLLGIKIIVGIY